MVFLKNVAKQEMEKKEGKLGIRDEILGIREFHLSLSSCHSPRSKNCNTLAT
ncbi:MAG: hypothetical protein ABIF11_04765 [Nitrospirota bacterium]